MTGSPPPPPRQLRPIMSIPMTVELPAEVHCVPTQTALPNACDSQGNQPVELSNDSLAYRPHIYQPYVPPDTLRQIYTAQPEEGDVYRRLMPPLVENVGGSLRSSFLTSIKRFTLKRDEPMNEVQFRTQCKSTFVMVQKDLCYCLTEVLLALPHLSPERIIDEVWKITVVALYETFPLSKLETPIERLVPPQYLQSAQKHDAMVSEVLGLWRVRRPLSFALLGQCQGPLYFSGVFIQHLHSNCTNYIAGKKASYSCHTAQPLSAELRQQYNDYYREILRIETNWKNVLVDLMKVVIYVLDTTLTSPNIKFFDSPILLGAACLQAAFICMKIRLHGDSQKLVASAWQLAFPALPHNVVAEGVDIVLMSSFNTTDKDLVAQMFEYEQQQYKK